MNLVGGGSSAGQRVLMIRTPTSTWSHASRSAVTPAGSPGQGQRQARAVAERQPAPTRFFVDRGGDGGKRSVKRNRRRDQRRQGGRHCLDRHASPPQSLDGFAEIDGADNRMRHEQPHMLAARFLVDQGDERGRIEDVLRQRSSPAHGFRGRHPRGSRPSARSAAPTPETAGWPGQAS
jgi:hypothetical protein